MAAAPSFFRKTLLASRALFGLALARIKLASVTPGDIIARNKRAKLLPNRASTAETRDASAQVRWAISRVAGLVPWRSDCLVQALAGQSWLLSKGIPAEITIGAKRDEPSAINAHAWLTVDAAVILGGEIDEFEPLLSPDNQI